MLCVNMAAHMAGITYPLMSYHDPQSTHDRVVVPLSIKTKVRMIVGVWKDNDPQQRCINDMHFEETRSILYH